MAKTPDQERSMGGEAEDESTATYRRRMPVSLERMIENALDWEHLPWLHSDSFEAIELVSSDRWHWRAEARLAGAGGEVLLELRLHEDRLGWTTATLRGSGSGTRIVTRVVVYGARDLEVIVDFLVPNLATREERDVVGASYAGLYRQLYDEDESMMTIRQDQLDARERATASLPDAIDLGPASELRRRLPLSVVTPRGSFRIVEHNGALLVHSVVCPHRLGPLGNCSVIAAKNGEPEIVCPWHGYRFQLSDGSSADQRGYRLAPAPGIETRDDGRARLVWVAADSKTR